MNVHPIGEPGAITISAGDQTIAALRRITVEQLLHFSVEARVVDPEVRHARWRAGLRGLRCRTGSPL